MVKVLKRDCTEVEFIPSKISDAIMKAMKNGSGIVKPKIADKIAEEIYEENKDKETISVYDIENLVYNKLISKKQRLTAKAYEGYRSIREFQRDSVNTIDEDIKEVLNDDSDYWKHENANKNPMLNPTKRDYMAGIVSADLTRKSLLPPEIVQAHDEGIIHFHDADYFVQHMHNCFTGGTKFLTENGLKQFKDYNDGDSVYIKDKNGDTRLATVHKYGRQKMQKVTFKNPRMEHTVICTANHRWILSDGSVTTSLKIGDKLIPNTNHTYFEIDSIEKAKAFCMGFIIGDGVDCANNSVKIRLCGDKTKYKNIFSMCGFSKHNVYNSETDIEMYKNGACKQDFLNGKSWRIMTPIQKEYAFFGYYAADGAKKSNVVATADERVALFIEETSGMAGYFISSKKLNIRDTNYKKNAMLITYHFVVDTKPNWLWTVSSIENYQHGEVDAWCVEEPVTHSFTLEKGIITGNCDLVNLEDMLQNGTVISDVLIEKPHSFPTACTVTTQAIAQIASNQYGGQSISLAHLAPFVDVSRQKIRKELKKEISMLGISKNAISDEYFNSVIEKRVHEEIEKGIQTIQYQLTTLMTTNGQAPFITIYMYLNEAKNEQEKKDLATLIEEMLKQRILGVKNEDGVYIAPAFPKLIYVLEDDNSTEDSKYWYLTRLAAECSSKRLVPDYISEKVMLELKGDVYTCMGCRSFLTPDRFTENGIGNVANALNYEEGKHKYYGRSTK